MKHLSGVIIKTNRAKCKLCGDIVESVHVHDFTTCKCGNLSVDGGKMYIKRCFKKPNSFIELSDYDELREEVEFELDNSNSDSGDGS